jgi:hypothetical protein
MVIIAPLESMPIWVPESLVLPVTGAELLDPELLLGSLAFAHLSREALKLVSPVIAFHIAGALPLKAVQSKNNPMIIRIGPITPPSLLLEPL